jgi:hypothetical protein
VRNAPLTRRRAALGLALVALVTAVFAAGWWIRGPSVVLVQPSASPTAQHRAGLPDSRMTPGAINPAVAPATLDATICLPGWTRTVRPPSAYTSSLKLAQILEYGYSDRDPKHYEEDHLVPLELGGAPRDPRNLWPQPETAILSDGMRVGADTKDQLENALHREVCGGTRELAEAQVAIAGDWVAAWIEAGRP